MSTTSRDLPDYWPWMVAYHRVREPLYRRMIADLSLAPDARVLDAGCGDGFYSQLLATMLGPRCQIVAIDLSLALLNAAGDQTRSVQRCVGALEDLGLAPASFDVVWLCRSMHSAPDPLARLGALVSLLRPGGRLIVVENDTAHSPILPFSAQFEHRLRAARLRYERARSPNGALSQRYKSATYLGQWLHQLGLLDRSVRTYVSEDLAPFDDAVEAYWRQLLAWDANLLERFLSPTDAAIYCSTFDPHSPNDLLSRPGCYCLELTTLACARRPEAAP